MDFRKYNSIENSYQLDFINAINEQGFQNQEYIVQEKVHGANICFITDGNQIVSAKRTELILDDEKFFNSNSIQKRYESNILQLFKLVSKRVPNVEQVTVFGELFGGVYPHAEVAKVSSAILVQKGIYYSPDNDFYAFDILVNHDQYLDTETINELFETTGFLYAKTLFCGSLDDCLKYPNNFQSTIPKEFGLPELKQNICEGVVIRPAKPCFFKNGSRVLIKNKNERWKENNNFLNKGFLKASLNQQETLSDDAQLLCEEITKFISENRLNNVVSKIGSVSRNDFGRLLGLFCKDALDDFLKVHKNEYEQLEKFECKAINKFLNTQSVTLVSDYLKNV
mgnify:FL=1